MEALKVLSVSSQPWKHLINLASASSSTTIRRTSYSFSSSSSSSSSSRFIVRCCTSSSSSSSSTTATTRVGGRNRRSSTSSPSSSTSDRDAVRAIRLKKVEELRIRGFEPYAYKWERTHTTNQLQDIYRHLSSGEESNCESDFVSVAGRIVARRAFGKLAFLTLRDDSGTIQHYTEIINFWFKLYCEKERLEHDQFEQLKTLVDVGDILGASGSIKRTEKGELSVNLNSFSILSKSLLPLPDKYHGLTDVDKRYRQRYVDMIANPEVADIFRKRAKEPHKDSSLAALKLLLAYTSPTIIPFNNRQQPIVEDITQFICLSPSLSYS
ncbi:hypothetical protein TEA_023604 [Camellia sinensis var. sinensis]|uniref:lysine--tRNA ligase n=1 Tax=Camellia sinensis var. sinensis TaxID=542762 RepID=A0A4S4D5P4_CAMSN|nr:hypothetical protein TEA_023604 [Camellia sinensis var. sinensis]